MVLERIIRRNVKRKPPVGSGVEFVRGECEGQAKLVKHNRHHLVALIDNEAIIHNCRVIKGIIGYNCKLCAVVKCNAYGHGIDAVLPAMFVAGVEMLAVATIDEARQLRQMGWSRGILLLGSEFGLYNNEQKRQLAGWIVRNDLRITVTNIDDLIFLAEAASNTGKKAYVHLKLDTGMSRGGVYEQQVFELVQQVIQSRCLELEGLYTHLATADEADKSYAREQLRRFDKFLSRLGETGISIPVIHAANSGAVMGRLGNYYDMVRCGIAVYGYMPGEELTVQQEAREQGSRVDRELQPALKLISYIDLIKEIPAGSYIGYGCSYKARADMLIGVVPIGYGDGYDRRLSNKGRMRIGGYEVPVVGNVSMDQTVIDLSGLRKKVADDKLQPGLEVTIIDDNPDSANSVVQLAKLLGTIPYEIVTRLGQRVHRCRVSNRL